MGEGVGVQSVSSTVEYPIVQLGERLQSVVDGCYGSRTGAPRARLAFLNVVSKRVACQHVVVQLLLGAGTRTLFQVSCQRQAPHADLPARAAIVAGTMGAPFKYEILWIVEECCSLAPKSPKCRR